jgi:hypothetical protein
MTESPALRPSRALVEAFQELAARLHSSEDYEDTFARITSTAAEAIEGCDAASISTVDAAGPVSHGVTDELARRGDVIQYEEGEGPCLDAAMQERCNYTPDLSESERWPASSRRLHDIGVRSMFACRLALDANPTQTLGGMNLYSRTTDGFSEDGQLLAILLASLGAVAIDASRQRADLRAALESRQVIGEAIGILRAQGNVNSEQAFEMLSKASQRLNVKLRDLARQIADGSVGGP